MAIEVGELIRLFLRFAPDLLPRGGASGLETLAWPSARPPINCAACGKPMEPVMLHGITVDRCYQDELVWFDARELDKLIDAAIAGHHARKGWAQRLRELLFAS